MKGVKASSLRRDVQPHAMATVFVYIPVQKRRRVVGPPSTTACFETSDRGFTVRFQVLEMSPIPVKVTADDKTEHIADGGHC